jgi:hypothetical protein
MSSPQMTLGNQWQDQFLAGVTLLHKLLHLEPPVRPRDAPKQETLVNLLEQVALGSYNPSKYFQTGGSPRSSLVVQPPKLVGMTTYLAIGLNGLTPRGQFASTATGGILFEEPVWAIVAAHSLSQKIKPALAVPLANDNDELWNRLSLLADAVSHDAYKPSDYLAKIDGFVPPAERPKFELLMVESDQLSALRTRGVQAMSVGSPPRFFELFQRR